MEYHMQARGNEKEVGGKPTGAEIETPKASRGTGMGRGALAPGSVPLEMAAWLTHRNTPVSHVHVEFDHSKVTSTSLHFENTKP